jgi:hypothetical protein
MAAEILFSALEESTSMSLCDKALKRLQRTAGIASNKTLKNKKIFPKEDHN